MEAKGKRVEINSFHHWLSWKKQQYDAIYLPVGFTIVGYRLTKVFVGKFYLNNLPMHLVLILSASQ